MMVGNARNNEKCTCLFDSPGSVSYECENCRRKRQKRMDKRRRDGTFNYGVGGDGDQQAE